MHTEEYFRGKGCIVTGAASGIGLAVSEALLKAGAIVWMADRDAKTLQDAVGQLAAHADRIHSAQVDVTEREQVRQVIEGAASRHGRLDLLFNNAGVGFQQPIEQVTLEQWERIIDVNLWGVIYGVHYALPIMLAQGGGHIVSTSSITGLVPTPFQSLYTTTKHAVVGLSESLRIEMEDRGIHFTVVCPGYVATRIFGTPIIGERVDREPPAEAISAEEAARVILAGVANREGVIVLPEKFRQLWMDYRTSREATEDYLRDRARDLRTSRPWEAGGPH